MKTIVLILALLLPFGAIAAEQIYVSADQTFRGPFADAQQPQTGETVVTLTAGQFAQYNFMVSTNAAGTAFLWDGSNFLVKSIEQLKAQLLTQFATLSPGEQAMFHPTMEAVREMLLRHNVPEARLIISLSGLGMPQDIANVRTAMLAAIDALFPPPAQ